MKVYVILLLKKLMKIKMNFFYKHEYKIKIKFFCHKKNFQTRTVMSFFNI